MNHKGINQHRLLDNPLEKAYAEAWDKINEQSDILAYIISESHDNTKCYPTEREKELAATMIQWLGSPVGRNFVKGVLEELVSHSDETDVVSIPTFVSGV